MKKVIGNQYAKSIIAQEKRRIEKQEKMHADIKKISMNIVKINIERNNLLLKNT